MKKIEILDHGYIGLIDHMGTDQSIVRSARVSYDGKGKSTDERLINYLMKNGHNTPFESCTVTVQVKLPVMAIRQWHRHRTQSYSEVSARYTELPEEFYVPELGQITSQSKDNKQMRTEDQNPHAERIREALHRSQEACFAEYHKLLDLGCPRELARTVLPFGTYTKMQATANLHNWLKFISERSHPHAQHEIRVYSDALLTILEELYPLAVAAFKEHHR